MSLFQRFRFAAIAALTLAAVATVAIACGSQGGSDEDDPAASTTNASSGRFLALPAGAYGLTQEQYEELSDQQRVTIGSSTQLGQLDFSVIGSAGLPGQPGLAGGGSSPGAAATPAAAQPKRAPQPTVTADGLRDFGDSRLPAPPLSPLDQPDSQVGQQGQQRIIVRNVDMTIEAPSVAEVIDEIGRLTTQSGGWVVRTQNIEVHRGAIDIRVPADRLDETLARVRQLASKVTSEVSTSQDFTEEFTDTTARIRTQQDTVDALRALFNRAEKIEDALAIQREITRIQSDIESKQARVNFLSESAAFSLVRITVMALPQEMEIIAGDDILAAAGRPVRFRAEFTPPEGIDDFRISWDFGDGTSRQVVTGVAPVNVEGRVISAPVVHFYSDDTDSPFIVRVEVTGLGESGAAEGEDVIVVTVNRVPPIEVFAGENRTVKAGDVVKLRGSFTRPEGVENLRFTWDLGDGSAPVTIDADSGTTIAEIEHRFANSRPQSYNVVLTVRGETAAGTTEGVGVMQVRVVQPESLTAGGFAPGDTGKSAVRTLSTIGSGIVTAAIWIGVLSPLWLLAGGGAFLVYRSRRANLNRRTSQKLASERREGSRPPA